ncbi:MAG: hypothetical protein HRU17_22340 [Polyangiaceae bacterium]|nr:hypothetical protein [Polyangiaceae bacterium]
MNATPSWFWAAVCGSALVYACSDDSTTSKPAPDSGGALTDTSMESSAAGGGGATGEAGRDSSTDSQTGAETGVLPDTGADAAPIPRYADLEVPYPTGNPHTDDKATLGKMLFWEEAMSGNGTVACGSCHRGNAGGSDPRASDDRSFLPGPDDEIGTEDDIHGGRGTRRCIDTQNIADAGVLRQVTGRKPPTYIDAMWAANIFWDGRATSVFKDPTMDPEDPGSIVLTEFAALESQAVGPPTSPVEMSCEGDDWDTITTRLATVIPLDGTSGSGDDIKQLIADYGNSYPALFAAVFGEVTPGADAGDAGAGEITAVRIAMAIATHERRLKSDQTPFDLWVDGIDVPSNEGGMDAQRVRGWELFSGKAKCTTCHTLPTFSDNLFHYIGFHHTSWDEAPNGMSGREVVTELPADRGKLKTPTLRNVTLRVAGGLLSRGAGAGVSLEEIMAVYNTGGLEDLIPADQAIVSTDIVALDLTDEEITDIIKFMDALTDPRVAATPELAPFDHPTLVKSETENQ